MSRPASVRGHVGCGPGVTMELISMYSSRCMPSAGSGINQLFVAEDTEKTNPSEVSSS
ncbi:MAG: hypothetical protein IPP49_10720 [Saprospiraceae bacterium]|nr:hypothetical protein [Saprospiraceae bacterium]